MKTAYVWLRRLLWFGIGGTLLAAAVLDPNASPTSGSWGAIALMVVWPLILVLFLTHAFGLGGLHPGTLRRIDQPEPPPKPDYAWVRETELECLGFVYHELDGTQHAVGAETLTARWDENGIPYEPKQMVDIETKDGRRYRREAPLPPRLVGPPVGRGLDGATVHGRRRDVEELHEQIQQMRRATEAVTSTNWFASLVCSHCNASPINRGTHVCADGFDGRVIAARFPRPRPAWQPHVGDWVWTPRAPIGAQRITRALGTRPESWVVEDGSIWKTDELIPTCLDCETEQLMGFDSYLPIGRALVQPCEQHHRYPVIENDPPRDLGGWEI